MDKAALLGAWRLESFHRRNKAGETRPVGEAGADGLLIYTADGEMSAVISGRARAKFRSEDYRAATPEEARSAFKTYLSYCGRYTLEGETVTHHVEMSLFPNWVGSEQRRFVAFQDGKLVLSTPPILAAGEEWIYELVWRRP